MAATALVIPLGVGERERERREGLALLEVAGLEATELAAEETGVTLRERDLRWWRRGEGLLDLERLDFLRGLPGFLFLLAAGAEAFLAGSVLRNERTSLRRSSILVLLVARMNRSLASRLLNGHASFSKLPPCMAPRRIPGMSA